MENESQKIKSEVEVPEAPAPEAVVEASSETVKSEAAASDTEAAVGTKTEPTAEVVEEAKPASEETVKAEQEKPATEEVVDQEASKKEAEEDEDGVSRLPTLDPVRAAYPWYVVHTYSGFESRVKLSLEERIRSEGLHDLFGHIVVPEENVVELVRGEKKASKRKFFPGYMLIQCQLNEHVWHTVTETPKVTGFVGNAVDPVPLSPEEVTTLLAQMEGGATTTRARVDFETGDAIKVIDGPFADFNGTVDDVKPEKGKLRVLISIFGRNTPVELDFVQVEKV